MKFGTQRDEPFSTSIPTTISVGKEEHAPQSAEPEADSSFLNIDWLAVGLGLLALIAVGGLIPFWMWVYFNYNPPVK